MTVGSTVLLEVRCSVVVLGIAVGAVVTTVTVPRIAHMLIQIAGGMSGPVVVVMMAVAVLHFVETILRIAVGVEQVATVVVTTVTVPSIVRLLARANVVALLTIVLPHVVVTTAIVDGSVGIIRRIVVGMCILVVVVGMAVIVATVPTIVVMQALTVIGLVITAGVVVTIVHALQYV